MDHYDICDIYGVIWIMHEHVLLIYVIWIICTMCVIRICVIIYVYMDH